MSKEQSGEGGEFDISAVAKAYARWAPVYDLVFGAVFARGRKASIVGRSRSTTGSVIARSWKMPEPSPVPSARKSIAK